MNNDSPTPAGTAQVVPTAELLRQLYHVRDDAVSKFDVGKGFEALKLVEAHVRQSVESATRELSEELATAQARIVALEALVSELDAYWAWIDKENEGPITNAWIHGWRCPQETIDQGKAWRDKISTLRNAAMSGGDGKTSTPIIGVPFDP